MKYKIENTRIVPIFFLIFIISSGLMAQNRQLVWADEFDGTTLDRSKWSFRTGQMNDCVHYLTDRPANTALENGKLRLIALKESYQGYNYTASLIKTERALYWRYGRVEARIKLPGTIGFVPAFWMSPEDNQHGWWPFGGEIDIMEHPTNSVNKIYGTVHTGAYSSFTGSSPRGSNIKISDAETAFHVYAIEWTADKIDFFVGDQKYFTFNNESSGFEAWPFDQPFYVILNMAVGGGWVGDPDASTVFPAIMEVDYVRVYQDFQDISVYGADFVLQESGGVPYNAPVIEGAQYDWSVPNQANIVSGQNTPQIMVDWGVFSGNVELELITADNSNLIKYPVETSNSLIKNDGFEKGVKYWRKTESIPVEDFILTEADVHSGNYAIYVDVKTPGVNPWDVQLSQTDLSLKLGTNYNASFWAKSETGGQISAAVINSTNFSLYGSKTVQLSNVWTKYEFNFTAHSNVTASFNVDIMGGHTGKYYFDDLMLSKPEAENKNQIKNADFSEGIEEWVFNTYAPAQATASVENEEAAVLITTAGTYVWDIHLGQIGLTVEKGKEYTVSFDAYALAPREIIGFVGKNADPWTVYSGGNTFSLTTRRQTHTYSFIMNDPTDTQARLGFDIGTSTVSVFFDNVFLNKGTWPAAVTQQETDIPQSFKLYQNIPNPFNSTTEIKFELPRAAFVRLEIYDINGRLVETLLESYMDAGIHSLHSNVGDYASGTYFYRMTTDRFSKVNKMTLIK